MVEMETGAAGKVLSALADQFAELARIMTSGGSSQLVIDRVVQFAAAAVPGSEDASLTMVKAGRPPKTTVSTGELPLRVDALQYRTGEGPCLQALAQSDITQAPDLSTDQQWPRFAELAVSETGVRSMLAVRLFLSGSSFAALNFFATKPYAFTDESVATAVIFASYASLVQTNALHEDRTMNLERALESNREIGVAIGILVARKLLTSEQAFEQLRHASQNLHLKLRDIADHVTLTGDLPPVPTPSSEDEKRT